MSSTYLRLQDLSSVDVSHTQRVDEAVDISQYRTVIAQVRRVVALAGTSVSATLVLQHAAVLDEDSFVDVSMTAIDLTAAPATTLVVAHDLMRYLRWKATVTSMTVTAPAQFLIDVVARQN